MNVNPMLLCDFYKLSHRNMYPQGTQFVYSTWTPRASRIKGVNEVVVFGIRAFIETWLIEFFEREFFGRPISNIIEEYKNVIRETLGEADPETHHIEALHRLGYLPLKISALPEGTKVPLRTPVLTIVNTHKDFYWLTNYIETLMSAELWPCFTAATIAHEYRKIFDRYAKMTSDTPDFVQFQGHDFSMRGMMGIGASMLTGMGHLLSFVGTDTIPAILALKKNYGPTKGLVGCSVPASEHSVQCAYQNNDYEYIKDLITRVHPTGIVSIVSDGYDFWNVMTNVLPRLKNEIMARNGKVVIRPDSGDPADIICGKIKDNLLCGTMDGSLPFPPEDHGAIDLLWRTFGGTVNKKGYKVLDSHVGLIYGDAITLARAEDICQRLANRGFASTNVVLGIGSFTYQYNTRDTFGFALKSTHCVIDDKEIPIFKDPKTDDGTKKSQKGCVHVYKTNGIIQFTDGHSIDSVLSTDLLEPVFKEGSLLRADTLADIRDRLTSYLS